AIEPTAAGGLVIGRVHRPLGGGLPGGRRERRVGARGLVEDVDVEPCGAGPQPCDVEGLTLTGLHGPTFAQVLPASAERTAVKVFAMTDALPDTPLEEHPELHTTAGKLAEFERRHHEATVEVAERAAEKQH